jgi:hypothetical protein
MVPGYITYVVISTTSKLSQVIWRRVHSCGIVRVEPIINEAIFSIIEQKFPVLQLVPWIYTLDKRREKLNRG